MTSVSASADANLHAPCALKALEDPRLSGWLPGLHWKDNVLTLFPRACCQGSGQRLGPNEVNVCNIRQRFARLSTLASQFSTVWKHSLEAAQESPWQALAPTLTRWAQAYATGVVDYGLTLTPTYPIHKPSLTLWALAARCIWIHDIPVTLITLGHDWHLPTLTPGSALFIEQKMGFEDARVGLQLSTLAKYAEGARIPLWLDPLPVGQKPDKPAPGGRAPVRDQLRHLLRTAQSKSWQWAGDSCHSVLQVTTRPFPAAPNSSSTKEPHAHS